MTTGNTNDSIELRVDEIAQLFDTLDPFPFRERDLDREAEEFIVGWARELPVDQPIRIVVHFPESDLQRKAAQDLAEAFRRYFSYRSTVQQRDLTELFRIGRRSLGIGVIVLIACFAVAHLASGFVERPLSRMIEESFLILGWVANWRPLEIFLYDWWPIARRRDLYRRLSGAVVEARPFPASQSGADAAGKLAPGVLPSH
ncbi:hypothetical protein [Bradyrhizobium sediminis]|uniref:hypothetical protein n=1 Tax=Bradyrhizobium sediminis TaxID=2840469 RepID=UPI00201C8CEB|nr:hypothetical protein [Bradyrhizobium sediminis]